MKPAIESVESKITADSIQMQMEHDIFELFLSGYIFIFYHDLSNDVMRLQHSDNVSVNDLFESVENNENADKKVYLNEFKALVYQYVHPEDIKKVITAITPDNYIEYLNMCKSKTLYFRWKHENRYYIYVKMIVSKINGGCEKPTRIMIACQDVDEDVRRKLAQQEIKKRYEHGFYALSREYINVYYVNLDTAELVPYNMSNRTEGMFGDSFYRLNYDDAILEFIKNAVKEDDKGKMTDVLNRKSILNKFKFGDSFTQVYLNNDNEFCEMKCVKVTDDRGSNVCIMGFSENDDKIRAQQVHKKQRNFQMSLLNGLTREYHTVWLIHSDGTMDLYRTTEEYLIDKIVSAGLNASDYSEAINNYIDSNVAAKDKKRVKKAVTYEKLCQTVQNEGVYTVTYQRVKEGNKFEYHQMSFSKAVGSDGEFNLVMAFRNVDRMIREEIRQKERYESVIRERDMDGLTGIRNRYCYERKVRNYSKKKYKNISCIYIDVDNLHDINNTKGHAKGDELIKFVAKAIVKSWGMDHTFRIGGDEFVVFVFDSEKQKIIDEIEAFQDSVKEGNYSVSVGYEYGNSTEENFKDIIKSAEAMMYEQKKLHHCTR